MQTHLPEITQRSARPTERAAAHTRGPWAWNESRHCLRAAAPDPSTSAVHTIVELAHTYSGYVGSERAATQREGDANLQLILYAPCTLAALRSACAALLIAKNMLTERRERHADVPLEIDNAIDAARAAVRAATVAAPAPEVVK